jgi:hypothetical protein
MRTPIVRVDEVFRGPSACSLLRSLGRDERCHGSPEHFRIRHPPLFRRYHDIADLKRPDVLKIGARGHFAR